MTVRVGVIGTGVMGAEHARVLQGNVSGATVTAAADTVYDRAKAVAAETGARSFQSAEELITSPFVDAVLIASHDTVHAEQGKACLASGKPVLREKPPAPAVTGPRHPAGILGRGRSADLRRVHSALPPGLPAPESAVARRCHRACGATVAVNPEVTIQAQSSPGSPLERTLSHVH